MAISMIGDLRQHFVTTRHNTSLKNDLNTLVQELTSGEKSDLTSHLNGDQTILAGLDRQLQMLQQFSQSNVETGQFLSLMQTTIAGVDSHRETANAALLSINTSSTPSQIENAAEVARGSFDAVVKTLNVRSAGNTMFGGNNFGSNALADPEVIMADLESAVVGLTTAGDINSAIDAWFDAPAGGFETDGYLGDASGYISRLSAAEQTVEIGVRADDQAIRDTLKALAKGALAGEPSLGIGTETQQELQERAGIDLLSSASGLTGLQARIGYAEQRIEQASVRTTAQISSLSIARNDLVAADPFETATRLQSVQLQLKTHYTLTARLSNLSLTEYLR
ncbi:flagellin [Octadecabacter ascidiaceicola]|uniref:Flagellar hook-associated protein FlgL n=1 Tax=Octadecabacter ascidiaceicola TaxID=1655543 RepID=A0A238KE15_9RHOB|nr:flagellin [Octadecabacter ascidiaceicola]SMX40422.1 flagellar hook-associated protein FlgL [Octadecabacter ascidiaceicola]